MPADEAQGLQQCRAWGATRHFELQEMLGKGGASRIDANPCRIPFNKCRP